MSDDLKERLRDGDDLSSRMQAADRITDLEAEVARLRAHIAEQITHAQRRIQDGRDLGSSVWRIALEDIVSENTAALKERQPHD